jgi:hypothetical protein
MTDQPTKAKITKVTVTRAEGLTKECNKPRTVNCIRVASSILADWARTAPKHGGYDKCDFKIEFDNGNTYSGRYDLEHLSIRTPDLARHVNEGVAFFTGKFRPSHMTTERYARALATDFADLVPKYTEFEANHHIG